MTTARLAGFATRALALAIDGAIINVTAVVTGAGVALAASIVGLNLRSGDPVVAGLSATGWILLVSVYLVTFWKLTGQTPGMRFMGIRVIDRSGAPLGRWQSIRRLVGMALAALPAGAGFLLILVDDRRRGLQDYIASTLVIHDAPPAVPRLGTAGSTLPLPSGRRRPEGPAHLEPSTPGATASAVPTGAAQRVRDANRDHGAGQGTDHVDPVVGEVPADKVGAE